MAQMEGKHFETGSLVDSQPIDSQSLVSALLADESVDEFALLSMQTSDGLPQMVVLSDARDRHPVDYVYGLANVLNKLSHMPDETLDAWLRSSKQTEVCVLSAIFRTIDKCFERNATESQIFAGDVKDTLYEYVYSHICAFVTTLNDDHFSRFEELLLECVLDDAYVTSLLASDVWCFVCRSSTSQHSYDYCAQLMKTCQLLSAESNAFASAVSLLNSFLVMLDETDSNNFSEHFKALENMKVWKHLDVSRVLSSEKVLDLFKRLYSELTSTESSINTDMLFIFAKIAAKQDEKTQKQLYVLVSRLFVSLDETVCAQTLVFTAISEILIALMPNASNDRILLTLKKFKTISQNSSTDLTCFGLVFAKYLLCFGKSNRGVKLSKSMEKKFVNAFIAILEPLFKDQNRYYFTKHFVLQAMTDLSIETEPSSIITGICKSKLIKREFSSHLKHLKSLNLKNDNDAKHLENNNEMENKIDTQEKCEHNSIDATLEEDLEREFLGSEQETLCSSPVIKRRKKTDISDVFDNMNICVNALRGQTENLTSIESKQKLLALYTEFGDIISKI